MLKIKDIYVFMGIDRQLLSKRKMLTTNQGVVGSIPASRTKKENPAMKVAGFFLCGSVLSQKSKPECYSGLP